MDLQFDHPDYSQIPGYSIADTARKNFADGTELALRRYELRKEHLPKSVPSRTEVRRAVATLKKSAERIDEKLAFLGDSGKALLLFEVFPKIGIEDPPLFLRELDKLPEALSLLEERIEELRFPHASELEKATIRDIFHLYRACFGKPPPASSNGPFFQVVREAVTAMLGYAPSNLYRDYYKPALLGDAKSKKASGQSAS